MLHSLGTLYYWRNQYFGCRARQHAIHDLPDLSGRVSGETPSIPQFHPGPKGQPSPEHVDVVVAPSVMVKNSCSVIVSVTVIVVAASDSVTVTVVGGTVKVTDSLAITVLK